MDIEKKKAQVALRKFQEIAQLHVELLKRSRQNIRKYLADRNFQALSVEKGKADLVVRQLYDDVQQIFSWCSDLQEETWHWVQAQLRPLNERIQSALSEFVNEFGYDEQTSGKKENSNSPVSTAASAWRNDEGASGQSSAEHETKTQDEKVVQLPYDLEQRRRDADAQRQLLSDILELNEIMKEMDSVVRVQGEAVSTIEGNVDRALSNVESGEKNLFKAMKRKASQYPLAGALIGAGAAGGPVGLVIGLKVAAVAAIGGCAIGALSGRFIQKRITEDPGSSGSHEMQPLSLSRGDHLQ